MTMNLSDLESLLNSINECIKYYEESFLKNKSFLLYLGNGDKIKYSITPANLPHLLGIKDINAIKNALHLKTDNTLDDLKEICSNPYGIYTKVNNGILNYNQIFSKFIQQKIENFKINLTSTAEDILDQTLLVCSYKSERSWEHTTKNQKYDYIIVKQLEDGKISLLCLVENQGQYYAMSNQLFESMETAKETLDELIRNQEVTLLTGVSIYNIYTDSIYTRTLSINQKLDKIDEMKANKQNFEYFIDISNDYEYTINKLRTNRNEKTENNNIIEEIVSAVISKSLIKRERYEDSTLLSIIDAWNDHICNHSSDVNNEFSYTDTIKELNALKKLATTLQNEKDDLANKVSDLEKINTSLSEENAKHLTDKIAIMKILKPEN